MYLFLWCKATFSASLLQSSVSHDPSEMILILQFGVQEGLLILLMLKVVKLVHFFGGNRNFFFSGFVDE